MQNKLFLVHYFLMPDKVASKRQEHRHYIRLNRQKIVFGGVVGNQREKFGVMYIVIANEEKEALQFYQNDPYSSIAVSYEIHKFEQKIPNIS